MLSLVHGPDIFRAHQFIFESHPPLPDTTIDQIDGHIINPSSLSQIIEPLQLFATKKVIIMKNILNNKQSKTQDIIKKFLTHPDPNIDIVFWEQTNIDKRSWLYKFFQKLSPKKNSSANPPVIFEFQQLSKNELTTWLRNYCQQKNIVIDTTAITKLITINQNSFFLTNELQKLKHYTNNHITTTAITTLTPTNPQEIIFDLTDQIGQKQNKLAYQSVLNLIKKGEDPFRILATLTTHIQNLLIIKDLLDRQTSLPDIKQKTHIHPYVLPKIITQSKNFSKPELISLHHQLTISDFKIKSGQSNFPEEIYHIIFH